LNDEYLAFAVQLVKEAGAFILPQAGKAGLQTMKSAKDFVTEMDIKAENLIVGRIKEQYPEHRIFSEEAGIIEGSGDYEWVIDPIDGTVNYSMGLPMYGISIALTYRDEPIVAAISLPAMGETFWAAKGQGAFLDGVPLKIRETVLAEAFVSFGDFAKDGNLESNKERLKVFESIVNEVGRIRMVGTAALSLAYMAAGRLDAALYMQPNFYDIAAGQLLIAEAGATMKTAGKFSVFASDQIADGLIGLMRDPGFHKH
jgi:myo-inositol-1(or 4)-monophosphatase